MDSETACRDSLVCLLRVYGYDCMSINSISELSVTTNPAERPCVLLADVGTHFDHAKPLHRYLDTCPTLPYIALSSANSVNMAVAYTRMGAVSFLPKPAPLEMLLKAVKDGVVLSQKIFVYKKQRKAFENRLEKLSPRERQVMDFVIEGKSSSQIALELNLSIKTVSLHRTNLMNKLQANGVVQLVRMVSQAPMLAPLNQNPMHAWRISPHRS